MSNTALITQIFIAAGGLLMLMAILRTRKILRRLRNQLYEKNWKLLIALMLFFIAGYLASVYFVYLGAQNLILILTGIVFFFGALFVYLVVSVSYNTIIRLQESVTQSETEIISRKKIETELFSSREKLSRQNNALRFLATNLQITEDDIMPAFRMITEKGAEALNVQRTGIWLFDKKMENITCADLYESDLKLHSSGTILFAKDYPAYFKALRQERVISADDAHNDPRTSEFSKSYLSAFKISSMLDAPIRIGGKLMGIVCHEHVGSARKWTYEEQFFAGAIADMASLAMLTIERIKTEKELRKSEERFRKLAEAGFEGIAIHDKGTIVETNSTIAKMFGYSENGVIGLNVLNMAAPESEKIASKIFFNGETHPVELTGLRKDKTKFAVEIQGAPIEYHGKQMSIVAVRDVSLKKQTEKEKTMLLEQLKKTQIHLRHSLSLTRAALESTADGILVVNMHGKITSYNKRFLQMWRIPESILLTRDDKTAIDFIVDRLKEPQIFLNTLKKIQADPASETFDTLELTDGSVYERFSKPQVIGNEIVGRVLSFRDVSEQKRTQIALKQLNEELEQRVEKQTAEVMDLYNNAPAGYHSLDKDGKILRINDTELKWFGYSRKEMLGKQITEFLDEKGKDFFGKNFPALQNNQGITDFEATFIRKNGSRLDVLVKSTVINDEKGNFLKTRSVLIDITEKKRLETALKQTEEKYRNMIETAGDVMYTTDPNGIFTYINQRCFELTGYNPEEIIGKSFLELIAPDWKEKVKNFYLEQFTKKIRKTLYSFQIITKNGEKKWVEQTVMQLRDNGYIKGHQSIVRDVTSRIKAEEELRLSEERYRSLAENAPVVILALDRNAIIQYSNRVEQTETKSNLVGSCIYDLMHPIYVGPYKEKLSKVFREGVPEEIEMEALRADGTMGWFSTMIAPVKKNGKTESAITISLDITGRKKAQEEIEKLNIELNKNIAELEAANKDLESFTYSVSHDLRAPLRSINVFTSIIKEKYENVMDEEGKKFLESVMTNALSMSVLIDDLLSFSRLGKKELVKTLVDVKTLLHEIVHEMRITQWNPASVVKIADDLLPAQGDRALIHQVFFNLIANALKFSHKKEHPVVEIGSYRKNEEIIYFVKDNGAGFDMQYYDKLFKVFQRLHSPAEFEGSGVGLAIVQRIMVRHGGRVWAEGKVNEGATFFVALPAED